MAFLLDILCDTSILRHKIQACPCKKEVLSLCNRLNNNRNAIIEQFVHPVKNIVFIEEFRF